MEYRNERQAALYCFLKLSEYEIREAFWESGRLYETSDPPDYARAKLQYENAMLRTPPSEKIYAFYVFTRFYVHLFWDALKHRDMSVIISIVF